MVYRKKRDAEEMLRHVALRADIEIRDLRVEEVEFLRLFHKARTSSLDVRLVTEEIDGDGFSKAYLFSAFSTCCDEIRDTLRDTFGRQKQH